MALKILSVNTIVKETDSEPIIDIEYTGEYPNGTQVTRVLKSVQGKLAVFATPPETAVIELVTDDLRKQWKRVQAEEERKQLLQSIADTISTAEITVPIEISETEPEPVAEEPTDAVVEEPVETVTDDGTV